MTPASILFRSAACTLIVFVSTPAHAAANPAALFSTKCASCHTYGHGDKVGPDLKGATNRHSRNWLTTWIRSSERTIKSGDPAAVALFQKYKRERMPDQNFSAAELDALISYIEAAGPEAADGPRVRRAATATPAEVARGKDLFMGATAAGSGGASCASCHMVREFVAARGATFGGDLTHVYSRFQDDALTAFMKQPCFPRVFGKDGAPLLTADEAFAIKAFLRQVDRDATPAR